MNNQQAYNAWASSYDAVRNRTRDIEAAALREILAPFEFESVLEIGCGTGKNTEWFLRKARRVVGADFSETMLEKAREKITAENVEFVRADIRERWNFAPAEFDLVSCSLALEHIENIYFVFGEAARVLKDGGLFYIGELHPFKQYAGSKARFDTPDGGTFELECFVHHASDFFVAGKNNSFECIELAERFDDDDRAEFPRLLAMLFRKNS